MMKQGLKGRDIALLPLNEEYEESMTTLKSELSKFWDELERLQSQVREVTAENESLSAQLAEAARSRLAAGAAAGTGDVAASGDHRLQLETAVKERDSAVQLWQASAKEVERLTAALSAAAADTSDHRWQRYTEKMRSQYARAVSAVTGELTRQREEAQRAAAALSAAEEAARAADSAAAAQRQQLQRLTEQLSEAERRARAQHEREQQLEAERARLAEAAGTHDQRLRQAAEAEQQLRQDLLEARTRCVQLSEREAEALDKLKEGVDVVQNALLEREEAVQKAARLEGDVAELEASLGRLADEAGLRTRQEVDTVRELGNRRLAELSEKLQHKDAEEAERQQLMERLVRDKRKIETEYDRLKEEHGRCRSGEVQSAALQQLTDRLSRLEDARAQAETAAAELTRKLTATQSRHAVELERAAEDAAERQRRLEELADACDELLEQKRTLTEELAAARAQQDAELAAATERRRQLERTVSSLEREMQQKEWQLNSGIQSCETDHEHTKAELRQQLTEQQQLSARWRRELLALTERSGGRTAEMRRVQHDLARRITELEDELRDVSERRTEAEEEVKRHKARARELELRVQLAEKRFLTVRSEARRLVTSSVAPGDPRLHLQLED